MADSFSDSSITAPPTSYLPPIKSLSSLAETSRLQECLAYLRQIYVPNVRGSSRRRKRPKPKPSNGTGSSSLAVLRRDPFERAYSLRWLSALIRLDLPKIQEDAAALLAICAGTAAAGTIQRQFEFDLDQGRSRIQIALNDVPLSTNASNGDYFSSVGAQTWGGACVLAEEITNDPNVFFPASTNAKAKIEEETFRVLELGAGTGLVSLVARKVALEVKRKMDIIATDYYPSVLDNLKANIETNFPTPSSHPHLAISSQFLDWSSSSSSDLGATKFDLILGADIIYEPLHASWIHAVVGNTLRRPSIIGGGGGLFHLVIPLRPSFAAESSTIEQVFHMALHDRTTTRTDTDLGLVIFSKEIILCDADSEDEHDAEGSVGMADVGDEDGDEDGERNVVRYAYYVIGWGR
ncbi:hypothetical protein BT96DRAFT_884230 [Gymnopus androsaceus JB14]|uniref:S-adenosyl-L-methionine-dependent methyltransferase n=1 Tax=Gymnopus androsaceus JB14 TaxID=1447944 RepID=A0A6A4HHZ4_9AGAR|nr:hypothetical protein BT96DRAFT_884230 [Gymnopus androsaceus JB14]